jgi:CBS domain containing-hemolysin-like protein
VTLEDIVEEIFGEFVDETDKELTPIKNDGDLYIVQ